MVYLEQTINDTFVTGFGELQTMVLEAAANDAEDLAAPPPSTPLPSPSPPSSNSTRNVSTGVAVEEDRPPRVVDARDEVQSWTEAALEAVSRLTDDLKTIKWKANRVSFDVLHDHGDQYGFFRSVASERKVL